VRETYDAYPFLFPCFSSSVIIKFLTIPKMYLHVLSKGLRVDIMTKQERKFVYTQEYDLYILGKSQCEKEKERDSVCMRVCVRACVCARACARACACVSVYVW